MSAGRTGASRRPSRPIVRGIDVTEAPHPRRGPIAIAIALTIAAWLAIWAPQLFSGAVLLHGDWPVDVAYSDLSADRWREAHERTLWNPYVFLGVPAAASLADSRPQYLPDPLLDAVSALDRFPVWPPLVLPLLAHLAGMLAAAGLARALWKLETAATVFVALAWGLMPFQLVPLAFGHRAQLVSVGLMPVSLLLVHVLFAAGRSRRAAIAGLLLAKVVAIQILAGHPQFTYLSLLLSGAFAVERALHEHRASRLAIAAGAVALGVLMSAAVWMPMLRYGADSVRGGRGVLPAEVRLYSLALRDFASFVWTGAVGRMGGVYWGGMNGTDFPQYFGAVVVLLALFAWRRGSGRPIEPGAAVLFAAAALFAVVLALGVRLGPFYLWIHEHVPFWSRFRVAVAPLIVAQLAAVLLAARGLQSLLDRPPGRWPGIAAAALTAVGVVIYFTGDGFLRDYAALAMRLLPGLPEPRAQAAAMVALPTLLLTLLTLVLALAAIVLARGRGRVVAIAALLAIVAFDLGLASLPMLRDATAPRDRLLAPPPTPLARLAATETGHRASSMVREELMQGVEWIRWRVPWTGGAHGTPPRRWAEVLDAGLFGRPAVQRAFGAAYVSGIPGTPWPAALEPVSAKDGDLGIARLRDPLPRAWAVPSVERLASDAEVLAAMSERPTFPDSVAFTTDPSGAGLYPGSSAAAVRWTLDTPDRIRLEVRSSAAAFVVVSDAWFAGWTARVDGAATPIHRVNHLLRGVALPAGISTLTMEYRPPGWDTGRRLALGGWILWLLLFGVAFFATRGAGPGAPIPAVDPSR